MYNAHLDVVHESIAASLASSKNRTIDGDSESSGKGKSIGNGDDNGKSKGKGKAKAIEDGENLEKPMVHFNYTQIAPPQMETGTVSERSALSSRVSRSDLATPYSVCLPSRIDRDHPREPS